MIAPIISTGILILNGVNNLNMSTKRRPWGSEEDDAISLLVKEYGVKQWALVASMLNEQFGIKGR